MLSSILAKSTCASCKFCCSFRRQSLWETPIFDEATKSKLQELFPNAKFRKTGTKSFTFDISENYKTSNPEEEALCPFLDPNKGCALPPELKPFDCKIWPLRAVKNQNGEVKVALTNTCPAINKVPVEKVRKLVESGLGKEIHLQAKNNPDMVKEFKKECFVFLENSL